MYVAIAIDISAHVAVYPQFPYLSVISLSVCIYIHTNQYIHRDMYTSLYGYIHTAVPMDMSVDT